MENRVLFGESIRLERWIRIQTSFIKFICHKSRYSKEQLEQILLVYNISPYEVLQSVNEDIDEFEVFKDILLSKGNTFKGLHFNQGIDYVGLCNTGTSLLIKEWNEIAISKLKKLTLKLKEIALAHKNLVQIGRTHGIQGEPTSYGYRFALMYSDIKRYLQTIFDLRPQIEVVTFDFSELYDAATGPELQLFIADDLGLFCGGGNSPHTSRNAYETYICTLNGLAQTLNKYALDLSFLSEEEVGEIKADKKVKKEMTRLDLASKNSESFTNLYIELSFSTNSNNPNFFRKQEHCVSEVMRYCLDVIDRFIYIIENIEPDLEGIENNLSKATDTIYSQKLLLYLIKNTNESREEISEELKRMSSLAKSNKHQLNFKYLVGQSKYAKYLEKDGWEKVFDKDSFLVNIDNVYERIFRGEEKEKLLKKVLWNEEDIQYSLERLAEQLNREYSGTAQPITIIAFAERSLVFSGQLILKLNFPISFSTIPHQREDLEIKEIRFDKELIHSRRILILEMLIHKDSNLDRFIDKLYDIGSPLDVRTCCLLKTKDVTEELFRVDWVGIECEPDDFYAGFGKNCGSSRSFRNLPMIGLAA